MHPLDLSQQPPVRLLRPHPSPGVRVIRDESEAEARPEGRTGRDKVHFSFQSTGVFGYSDTGYSDKPVTVTLLAYSRSTITKKIGGYSDKKSVTVTVF